MSSPPDGWSGRAAVDWTRRLAAGERSNPEIERLREVARVLDAINMAPPGWAIPIPKR